MEDTIVTFETAMLSKSKGFNVATCEYYNIVEPTKLITCAAFNHNFSAHGNTVVAVPTQSLLQKWLREVHKIHITISVNSDNEGDEETKWYYSYINRLDNALDDDAFGCIADDEFKSYEEALEAALAITLTLINNDN